MNRLIIHKQMMILIKSDLLTFQLVMELFLRRM